MLLYESFGSVMSCSRALVVYGGSTNMGFLDYHGSVRGYGHRGRYRDRCGVNGRMGLR